MTAIANFNPSAEMESLIGKECVSPSRWGWWTWSRQAISHLAALFWNVLILGMALFFCQWLFLKTEIGFADNRTLQKTLMIAEYEAVLLAAGGLIYLMTSLAKWWHTFVAASLWAIGTRWFSTRDVDAWFVLLILLGFTSILLGGWFAMQMTRLFRKRFPQKQPEVRRMKETTNKTIPRRIVGGVFSVLKVTSSLAFGFLLILLIQRGLLALTSDIQRMEYEGKQAPNVVYETASGEPWRLSEQRGKVVLIDHWAKRCGPCRAAIPEMRRLYEMYGQRNDFVMIGVSYDSNQETALEFCREQQMEWNQLFPASPTLVEKDKTEELPVLGIPSVWIIDRDGKIVGTNLRGSGVAEVLVSVMDELSTHDTKNE